jgi:hypothetical protein
MSTAAVSSSSVHQQLQQYFQTRGTDLGQLGQALTSGNLSDAQTAYNNIVSLGQSGPFAGGNPFKLTGREQDFTAVGQALQSGDLAGAQQAFQSLVNTFRNLPGGGGTSTPEAPASSSAAGAGPEVVINLSSGAGNTNPEQITININESANNPQAPSSTTNQLSPTAQQITLNLNPANSEQIVLNLLGASSSTGSSASSSPANGTISLSA